MRVDSTDKQQWVSELTAMARFSTQTRFHPLNANGRCFNLKWICAIWPCLDLQQSNVAAKHSVLLLLMPRCPDTNHSSKFWFVHLQVVTSAKFRSTMLSHMGTVGHVSHVNNPGRVLTHCVHLEGDVL